MSFEKDSDTFPPIDSLLKLDRLSHVKLANNEFMISNFRPRLENKWAFYRMWASNMMFNFIGQSCSEFIEENQGWELVTTAERIHENTLQLPGLRAVGLVMDLKKLENWPKRTLVMIRSTTSYQSQAFVLGYFRCTQSNTLQGGRLLPYMEIFIREQENLNNGSYSIKIFSPCKQLFNQLRALARLQNIPELVELFVNMDKTLFHLEPNRNIFIAEGKFNSEQRRLIQKVVAAAPSPPHLRCVVVQGPPGTGKTHMLSGLIRTTINLCPGAPILVCASSNCAVDNVALKLLDCPDFGYKGRTLARLGNPDRIDARVSEHTSAYLSLHKTEEQKKITISKTHVLLCTLGSLEEASLLDQFENSPFRMIVFDEAEQTSVPEALAINRFKFDLLVLVGDPAQLPPLIFTQALSVSTWPSMLDRFMKNIDQNDVHRLVVQYRMLPEIMAFPSQQFYQGSLEADSNAGINEFIRRMRIRPYALIKFDHGKERRIKSGPQKGSVFNVGEANFICLMAKQIVAHIKEDKDAKPTTIAIISFYEAQRLQILRQIELNFRRLIPFVEVKNVDSIQGQERDIIIVSPVRVEAPGFIASEQRTNVALTRAKSALFVCSHKIVVDNHDPWRSLFRNAEQRQANNGERLVFEFPNASEVSNNQIRDVIFY